MKSERARLQADLGVISIHEDYGAYTPPRWVRHTIERLLASVPEAHLAGLSAVVLTDSTINRAQRRPRRAGRYTALARYHAAKQGEPAWIELVIDEIVNELSFPFDVVQLRRDWVFGRILFHELGHHLHETNRGVGRTGEHGADAWSNRLLKAHIRRTYGYMRPLVPLLKMVARTMRRL